MRRPQRRRIAIAGGPRRRVRDGRPAPARGRPRRRHDRQPASTIRTSSPSVSADWTTSTSIHHATSSGSAFAAQIAARQRARLPLVVHTRDAWDDTFDVLAAEGVPERTVFHCFTGGPDEARRCLDLGAFVSFSGIVTFRTADDRARRGTALPRSTGCSPRPTAPTSRRCPIGASTNQPAYVAARRRAARRPAWRGRRRGAPTDGRERSPCVSGPASVGFSSLRAFGAVPVARRGRCHDQPTERPMMSTKDRQRLTFAIALTVIASPHCG